MSAVTLLIVRRLHIIVRGLKRQAKMVIYKSNTTLLFEDRRVRPYLLPRRKDMRETNDKNWDAVQTVSPKTESTGEYYPRFPSLKYAMNQLLFTTNPVDRTYPTKRLTWDIE